MELKEIIEAAAKPKISIIMQSYLGNYPGSRKDSHSKFLRAVQSFQNQLYKNCELIIVADDCMETKALYNVHFKGEDNMRLIYVSLIIVFLDGGKANNTYLHGMVMFHI